MRLTATWRGGESLAVLTRAVAVLAGIAALVAPGLTLVGLSSLFAAVISFVTLGVVVYLLFDVRISRLDRGPPRHSQCELGEPEPSNLIGRRKKAHTDDINYLTAREANGSLILASTSDDQLTRGWTVAPDQMQTFS